MMKNVGCRTDWPRKDLDRQAERGQVIVLFALFLVVFLGAAALVLDVARAYTLQRFERSVADAAALAGAQDLQIDKGRTDPTSAQQTIARTDALGLLSRELGASATGGCDPTSDILPSGACMIGPYQVSVVTPYSGAQTVDANRAVKVSIWQPNWSLTFSRIPPFGGVTWNVGASSVAGLSFEGQYAVITLRPPNPNAMTDTLSSDVTINGSGTALNVFGGDVGTNTSVRPNPGTIALQKNFYVRYFDAIAGWTAPPIGKHMSSLIPDPKYPYPIADAGTPNGGPDPNTSPACQAVIAAYNAAWYPAAVLAAAPTYNVTSTVCWKPGVYSSTFSAPTNTLTLLEPGVYFMNKGVNIKGILAGGVSPNSQGVVLLIPQTQSLKMTGTPPLFALNMGTYTCSGVNPTQCTGAQATPALWSGMWSDGGAHTLVQTTTTPPSTLSIVVPGDPACPVVMPAPNCAFPKYNTIDYSGAGNITVVAIGGTQYAPSDNAFIAGNGNAYGFEGQIISWTVTYSGNSTINQHYNGTLQNGVLRLDTSCSPGVACP